MESRNPTTGALIARHPIHDAAEVERRLNQGWAAWQAWRRQSIAYRAPALLALAEGLTARRAELSALMTAEMGKPLSEARAEIDKCAWVCRHYAEHAEALLTPRSVAAKAPHNEVRFEPLGPVLSVMPWNFPFWQVLRFAAPALMAGNTVLIKHASNVVGCAQAIEHLGVEAGLPLGLLQELRIENDGVGAVIADPRVAAVTVTGSEGAGRAIAAQAGRHLKPSVLELGGSDAFIVLADADLDAALDAAVQSRCLNSGQSCIAAKRFIVEGPLHDAFVDGLIARMEAQVVGDPTDAGTNLGPLARPDLRDTLHRQVTDSIAAGASLRTGGAPLDGPGNFYPPTVLTDVPGDCPAAQEELFGPVAAVFRADDPTDAVLRANNTRFGLSSSLWTADRDRARRLATRIDAGAVFINQMSYSDPRLPFGGIGASGYGRELGPEGILEFVNVKTVSVA
jgi:succinate-semialdehyde dehydrogenase/glutarate-semialdehyde dehydrogenase